MWTFLAACRSVTPPDADVVPQTTWDPDAPLAERCFPEVGDPSAGALPQYDAYGPEVPRHCLGTDHQTVTDLDRVVFLGDSITAGTWPTPEAGYYRNLLVSGLEAQLGHPLETQDCSRYGARVDDLMRDDDQIVQCLGEPTAAPDERATLVVFTVGGNDMFAYAQDILEGGSQQELVASVDETIALFDDALNMMVSMRSRFPNGLHVVFGNLYEFTDATSDLSVCPAAEILGFSGVIPEVRDSYVQINEAWVRLAVETQTDVVFMLEHFCGHGFLAGQPDNECYRGPGTETWFDGTCIHPNELGHQQLAQMFQTVTLQ
jgi:lysophospholipase L1-like esterase